MAAAPAGVRVRTRLRVSAEDAGILRAVGSHLGSLAGRDLAARCAEGRLDARNQAASRARRKRALTGESSSRWAGAITRTSEDQVRLAEQNLRAERASLRARVQRIEARLKVPVSGKQGRTRGYATAAERHAKLLRLHALKARFALVERQLEEGSVSVTRGGRALLRKRANLDAAGLTEDRWRTGWDAARMFITADGEADKPWGNETLRWHPDERWLEVKLPAPLARLANRPHGRYRLSCPVAFPYRGDEVAAQAATGAIRYDITLDPAKNRWHLHASWKTALPPAATLDELRLHPVVAADVNAGHLAVAVVAADGNVLGTPFTVPLNLAGLDAPTRDGRLRNAISGLIATARQRGAHAIVIEDLDFAEARAEGRERRRNRPSRGRRGRAFRRAVSGIPTGRFRDRLVQMTANAGLTVIVVDPAYTSRWGAQHWLAPLQYHHPETTGHHAAALVTGRRGLGHRARRRASGNRTAPEEAARPARARPRTTPKARPAPRKPATPSGPRQPPGNKTRQPHRITAGNQAAQDRPGPPDRRNYLPLSQLGTVLARDGRLVATRTHAAAAVGVRGVLHAAAPALDPGRCGAGRRCASPTTTSHAASATTMTAHMIHKTVPDTVTSSLVAMRFVPACYPAWPG
ncbi:MAG TPA: transposase [Trebonia sp.]